MALDVIKKEAAAGSATAAFTNRPAATASRNTVARRRSDSFDPRFHMGVVLGLRCEALESERAARTPIPAAVAGLCTRYRLRLRR